MFTFSLPSILLAAPSEVVKPYGTEFYLNGTTFRFVGVNIRGLVHYGYSYPLF
ncbi:MAG: hypothetical protein QME64_06365 [bacterium]|nr:hypothetical protein [bacterium]